MLTNPKSHVAHANDGPQSPEFKRLLARPAVAWPTVAWFVATIVVWGGSSYAGITGWLPMWLCVLINAAMVFSMFTITHESSHRAISLNSKFNDFLGGVSTWFYGPFVIFSFKAFRYLHMQHHLNTNDTKQDPDYWAAGGTWLTRPFRWATVDLYYVVYYLRRWHERPRKEGIFILVHTASALAVFGILVYLGYGWEAFWLWAVPGRMGIFLLAYCLDYLPHTPHKVLQTNNAFRATSIRIGHEAILSPLLMCHNYHLSHHLYPLVPFYRYRKLWLAGEEYFLAKDPLILTPTGHQMTVEEYRAKKRAAH
jgi:ring-1,2-phenylacetyl-CoA epoxidase subunit PaaE